MTKNNSYTSIEVAKDGSPIPVSGAIFLHSRYNPQKEALAFAQQFKNEPEDVPFDFFVIYGIAGGYHIAAIAERFPQATIIAIEADEESLQFIAPIPCVQRLQNTPNIYFATANTVSETLKQLFQPAAHTKLTTATLRSWESCFPEMQAQAQAQVQSALKEISADFSVQSHFGGIWQRNIFMNLSLISKMQKSKGSYCHFFKAPPAKKAAIIAAGPSLDDRIPELKEKRSDYYIIATDTAYHALLSRKIVADACVSVDAQQISHAHFFNAQPSTLFIFDISANPAAIRTVAKKGAHLMLVETGHPLAAFASHIYGDEGCFAHIETGSGTVTIAAASFAIQAGFTDIVFFGADFAYQNGKPYTKGCYLDTTYAEKSVRTNPLELAFSRLMFRTALEPTKTGMTTALLTSYKASLKKFMMQAGYADFSDQQYKTHKNSQVLSTRPFDFSRFQTLFRASHQQTSLLPFIAWLKRKYPKSTYKEILSLAQRKSLVYTYEDET